MKSILKSALSVTAMIGFVILSFDYASADIFSWSYSGVGCTEAACGAGPVIFPPQAMNGAGTLTTSAQVLANGAVGNIITSFNGTWNGFTITGLLSTSSSDPDYFFNDNVLFYPLVSSDPLRRLIDFEGIGFAVAMVQGLTCFGVWTVTTPSPRMLHHMDLPTLPVAALATLQSLPYPNLLLGQ